ILFLLGLACKLCYDISSVNDLGSWDEASYMVAGLEVSRCGLPGPAYGPLYSVWYRGLSFIQPDPVRLYYFNCSLLICLLVVRFYVLVRALGGTRAVGLLWAFLVLVSDLVNTSPHLTHLATIILALGTALAVRVRPWPVALAVLSCALLLASYARPEYYVP